MPRGRPKKNDIASKAELIRQTAKALPKPIRPRDIIAALKEKGVDCYPQLRSALLCVLPDSVAVVAARALALHRKRRPRMA